MNNLKLIPKTYWQKAGAVALKKEFTSRVQFENDYLITKMTKEEMFESFKNKMLTKNGKPWESKFRPFLKQYNSLSKIKKILNETKEGKHRCEFCGRNVNEIEQESLLAGPFFVKSENFSNFYGGLKGIKKICRDCQFLGMMAVNASFYTRSKDSSSELLSYFFPEGKNLQKTYDLFTWIDELHCENSFRNIEFHSIVPVYSNEFFLLSFIELLTKTDRIYDCTFHILTSKISGRSASFIQKEFFKDNEYLKDIIEEMQKTDLSLKSVLDKFVLRSGKNFDTLPREKLSELILNKKDIENYLEFMLFKTKKPIKNLNKFIQIYNGNRKKD